MATPADAGLQQTSTMRLPLLASLLKPPTPPIQRPKLSSLQQAPLPRPQQPFPLESPDTSVHSSLREGMRWQESLPLERAKKSRTVGQRKWSSVVAEKSSEY